MQDQATAKRCGKCGVEKARSDFYTTKDKRNGRVGLQSYCKKCATANATEWRLVNAERSAAYGKRYRAENAARYREYDRARRDRSPAMQLVLLAKDNPCVDCGVKLPPQAMDLDHVRGVKSFGIGGPGLRDRDPAEVLLEIAKCDVRCPNCHRMRHYREHQKRKAADG